MMHKMSTQINSFADVRRNNFIAESIKQKAFSGIYLSTTATTTKNKEFSREIAKQHKTCRVAEINSRKNKTHF